MHIVRNAIDHGIENAEDRMASGKAAHGTIYLNAYHQGTQVVIEIHDDGRGSTSHKFASTPSARRPQSRSAQRLSENEVMNLIFEPGFSTAAEVTEVSGRGVGMDVVRTVMDRLKGTVHINSSKNRGTTIQLRAPLTLASIQTLLFRVGGRLFAVPLSSVVEITRINDEEIHRVDRREVLRLREQVLTLVRLNQLSQIHAVESPVSENSKRSATSSSSSAPQKSVSACSLTASSAKNSSSRRSRPTSSPAISSAAHQFWATAPSF